MSMNVVLLADGEREFREAATAKIDQAGQVRQRERTIADLMIPPTCYPRAYKDQRLRQVVQDLAASLMQSREGDVNEQGHRSILIFDRSERFVGCLRIDDILTEAIPASLYGSPRSTQPRGMFAAQCEILGNDTVGTLIRDVTVIDERVRLTEALFLLVSRNLINLPVLRGGAVVGVVRDTDLLLEIASTISS